MFTTLKFECMSGMPETNPAGSNEIQEPPDLKKNTENILSLALLALFAV